MYNTPVRKSIVITGPTGVGKSALALNLAKKINGSLISVDSIHVYKGCDIISGKDIPENATFRLEEKVQDFDIGYWEIDNIRLYLTDVTSLSYEFNISDYLKLVKMVLPKIEKLGKVPIFVGGSTLYIKSLLTPLETIHIPPDIELRTKLESANTEELQAILAKYDKSRISQMNDSDINNPRRLIRAIEIARDKKDHPTSDSEYIKNYKFLTFVLEASQDALRNKVEKRVESRIKHGAWEEIETLYKNYSTLSPSIKSASGYKELFSYLEGKSSEVESIKNWEVSDMQYAKKQITYFKKLSNITWIDTEEKNHFESLLRSTEKWLKT